MPRSCSVPKCRSNYKDSEFVTTFAFPKDAKLRKRWLKAIHRANFIPGTNACVCVHHFDERFLDREMRAIRDDGSELVVPRKHVKLTKNAFPTIFTHLPAYMNVKLPKFREEQHSIKKERQTETEPINKDKIRNLVDFKEGLGTRTPEGWFHQSSDEFVCVFKSELKNGVSTVVASLTLAADLHICIRNNGMNVALTNFIDIVGHRCECDSWTKFDRLLERISNYKLEDVDLSTKFAHANKLLDECVAKTGTESEQGFKLNFLREQLSLLNKKQKIYRLETLIWSAKMYYSNPSAYVLLKDSGALTIPHDQYIKNFASTLTCMCNENEDTIE